MVAVGTGPALMPENPAFSFKRSSPSCKGRGEPVVSCNNSESAPKLMRNATSFFFSTLEKNEAAARRSVSIRFCWLPETSTSRPMVSGRSVSRVST